MVLDVLQTLKDPEFLNSYGVIIGVQTKAGMSATISGVTQSEFSFSTGVSWESGKSLGSMMGEGLNQGGKLMSVLKTISGSSQDLLSAVNSILIFSGADEITMNLSIFFYNEAHDYKQIIERSLEISTPETENDEGGLILWSPLGYKPNPSPIFTSAVPAYGSGGQVSSAGWCIIKVGNFFHGGPFLCDNFTFTPSTQRDENGKPLYITGQYSFKAARAFVTAEIKKWFLK